ncbi:Ribonuclease H protein [Quillaja saponaria]|uniref:Ribonuclease H protein n=1 Tax=Quillaja saponaria TaxID=32244 RepID=A0AAD7Q5G9_QUISA|nr:Ribonuclease H protein [Quillaja saponaria]
MSSNFFTASFKGRLLLNLKDCSGFSDLAIPWSSMFAFVAWRIWNGRNKMIFLLLVLEFLINLSLFIANLIKDIWKMSDLHHPVTLRYEKLLAWYFPDPGWVKLNCHGASKGFGFISSCGSVIRGDSGEWLRGAAVNLGYGSNNYAEFFGIYHGFNLA